MECFGRTRSFLETSERVRDTGSAAYSQLKTEVLSKNSSTRKACSMGTNWRRILTRNTLLRIGFPGRMDKCKVLFSMMSSELTNREFLNAKSLLASLAKPNSQLRKCGTVKMVTKLTKKRKSRKMKRVKTTLSMKKTVLKARGELKRKDWLLNGHQTTIEQAIYMFIKKKK